MAELLLEEAPHDRIKMEVPQRKQYFLSLAKEGADSARGNLSYLEEYIKL
jgi:hypothetical protein